MTVALRGQEREPRRAARGGDPGAARVRAVGRRLPGVPATRPGYADLVAGERRGGDPCGDPGAPRSRTPSREEIERRHRSLGEPPVAVRSSALGEDSEEATFAGQQETLPVGPRVPRRSATPCATAGRACTARGGQLPRQAGVRRRRGDGRDRPGDGRRRGVRRDVHLQPASAATRAWSRSTPAGGSGWRSSAARSRPTTTCVSKVTGEIVRAHVGDKRVEYVPDPDGHGAVAIDVAAERAQRALPRRRRAAMPCSTMAKRVERHFGGTQDIEWAIARGEDATTSSPAVPPGHGDRQAEAEARAELSDRGRDGDLRRQRE